jgi:sugar phosphate permease
MKKPKKLFYGWWMAIVIAIMSFTYGAAPFAIILKNLMEQLHTGRGDISLGPSIATIAGGVAGIIAGRLLYRYRPRTFMLWGTVVAGVCALLLSLTTSLWYFYVLSFVSGVAGGFSSAIPTFTLLSKWFTRKWGTACGITQMGGSIGSMALSPLVAMIAENFGWQATYIFYGALTLAVSVPLILFVLKDTPQSLGLLPDGATPEEADATTKAPEQRATSNAGLLAYLKRPAMWLMCLGFAFLGLGWSAVVTHEVSFITDMKVSTTLAASAFGFTVGISAIASLASGWLSDRLSSRYVTIMFVILAIAGLLVLLQADTMPKVWLFVVLFGLGVGAAGTLLPIVTRDIFGAADFSALFGVTNVLFVVGYALGMPLAGFIFDATGSYHSVFLLLIGIYLLAILTLYFAYGLTPRPFTTAAAKAKLSK